MAKSNGRGGHLAGPKKYQAYMFRSKDPVIDELRTMTQDAGGGKLSRKAMLLVEESGGPTVSCQVAWYHGKTKRPNNATVEAAGRSLGRKRVWVAHRPNK
jgi:hypothetical protein